MMPPSGAQMSEYCARPTASRAGSASQGTPERSDGVAAAYPELAHVREVEEAGGPTDGVVLLDDRAIADRHLPAAELGEAGPERLMPPMKGRPKRRHAARVVSLVRGASGVPLVRHRQPSPGRRQGPGQDVPLGGKAHDRLGLTELEPAHLLELVVVVREVAAGDLHEEVLHGLVDAPAVAHEAVVDVADAAEDAHLEAGLLADLAQRRLLGRLVPVGRALRQRPGHAVPVATPSPEQELPLGADTTQDDATGGEGAFRTGPAALPRPGHVSPTAAARTRSDGLAGLGEGVSSAVTGPPSTARAPHAGALRGP